MVFFFFLFFQHRTVLYFQPTSDFGSLCAIIMHFWAGWQRRHRKGQPYANPSSERRTPFLDTHCLKQMGREEGHSISIRILMCSFVLITGVTHYAPFDRSWHSWHMGLHRGPSSFDAAQYCTIRLIDRPSCHIMRQHQQSQSYCHHFCTKFRRVTTHWPQAVSSKGDKITHIRQTENGHPQYCSLL